MQSKESIKWGVFTGFIESLIILSVSLVFFNREKILPLPGAWEFSVTLILFALLTISVIVSTVLLFWRPCASVCRGQTKDCILTTLSAGVTLGIFILLIIFASRVLI